MTTDSATGTLDSIRLRDELLDLPLGGAEEEASEPEPEAGNGDGPRFDPLPPDDEARDETGEVAVAPPPRERRGGGLLLAALALLIAASAGTAVWFLKPEPAVLQPAVEVIDFLAVPIGDRAERAFEVSNRGESDLAMLRTELGGADAADFAITRDDCSGVSLRTEDRCLIEVTFAPSARGRRAATLMVVGDAINAPVTLPMLGIGTAAELRVEPSSATFPSTLLGASTSPVRVRAANRGTTAFRVGDAIIEGLGSGDFVLDGDSCSGRTLGPNAECSLRVRFLPTRDGPRKAILWLRGAGADLSASVALEGTGLTPEPKLRLGTERLELGVQAVGEPGEGQTFAIANDGSAPLAIDAIALAGPDAERFIVDAADCTGAAIDPGSACSVSVVASPVEIGPLMARVTIEHTGGRGEVALSATGIAPQVRLVPLRIGLGESPIKRRGDGAALRVENVGMAPLRIGRVGLAGGDAGAFFVGDDACGGRALASGEACSIRVGVRPERPGPLRSSLTIAHNAGRESVPVTAFGVAGRLVAEPATLDFGEVAQGRDRSRRVVLSNRGRARLSVRPPRLEGGDPAHFRVAESTCSAPLVPGETCSISVAFLPRAPGPRRATLTVAHDGEGDALAIALDGRAAPPPRARVETRPGRLDFGQRPVASRGEIETVTIENPGNASLELLGLRVVGTHAADFQLVPGSCAGATFVAAGGSCTVGVRFTPSAPGRREASLEVDHRVDGTRSVPLVGEGF